MQVILLLLIGLTGCYPDWSFLAAREAAKTKPGISIAKAKGRVVGYLQMVDHSYVGTRLYAGASRSTVCDEPPNRHLNYVVREFQGELVLSKIKACNTIVEE